MAIRLPLLQASTRLVLNVGDLRFVKYLKPSAGAAVSDRIRSADGCAAAIQHVPVNDWEIEAVDSSLDQFGWKRLELFNSAMN